MSLPFARFVPFALMLAAPACVIHTEDWPGGDDGNGSLDNADLAADPEQAYAGERALFEIWDNSADVDFRDVMSVRPLGDFEVIEWTPSDYRLMLVLELAPTADGEQIVAIDFPEGSAFATFEAL